MTVKAPELQRETALQTHEPESTRTGRSFLASVSISLAQIALAVLVGLVLSEVVLGLSGLGNDDYLKPDPILGMLHLPGKDVTFRMEGFARQKINGDGFRDIDHQPAKPKGVRRIVFLGDSKTESLQVPLKDTFVKVIEERLNRAPDEALAGPQVRYETLNLAMASHSTVQEYLIYLMHARRYKPDTTVLVYNYMDSHENRLPSRQKALAQPFVYLDGAGHLHLTFELLDKWLRAPATRFLIGTEQLRRSCHLYQTLLAMDFALRNNNRIYPRLFDKAYNLVDKLFLKIVSFMQPPPVQQYQQKRAELSETTRRLDALVPLDEEPIWPALPGNRAKEDPAGQPAAFRTLAEETREDFLVTARLIRVLNAACKQDGSKLIVVTLPVPDGFVLYQKEVQLLQKMGQKDGFQVIDANLEFPGMKVMQKNPYYFTVHFTQRGHRKMADIILKHASF